jgi:alkylated DNA repair dioxygenase AlkB
VSAQLGLFGHEAPRFDAAFRAMRRTALADGAWVEHAPAWLQGHEALFEELARTIDWQWGEEQIYDRVLPTPRLYAVLPAHGVTHPLIEAMRDALSERYGEVFTRIGMAMYRDGRDSVAWHGDRVARTMREALVATVSVGAPRRFLLRPHGGGRSIAFNLGWGDLFVMGGSCQRTWQHSIPKVARAAPRIAIMFRPDWEPKEDE